MRPPGVPHWTDDECQFLQAFVGQHGHNWVDAARALRARFGDRRPYASDMIRKKWRQICLKSGAEPVTVPIIVRGGRRPAQSQNWTEVEVEVLVALVDELGSANWDAVAHGLAHRLGEVRKYTARNAKLEWASLPDWRRRPPSVTATNPKPWTEAHDQYLTMLVGMYAQDWDKMAEIFAKRFGAAVDVTGAELRARAAELDQQHDGRRTRRAGTTATTPSRRRRVAFDSSSDEMQIAEPKPKLPKPTPKRKPDVKARKSIAVPPSAETRVVKSEPDGDGKTEVAESGARPRSKSCVIQ